MTTSNTSPNEQRAMEFAEQLINAAPHGALTVVDEDALSRRNVHWDWLALALKDLTGRRNQPLMWADCGGGKHGTGEWLARNFGGAHLHVMNDWDPDFSPLAMMGSDALPPELDTFGTPTLTCVAQRLQDVEAEGACALLVLDDIAGARPYDVIAVRQLDISDPDVRDGARRATFEWRAADLVAFASTRPDAATIVATHDKDPGRQELLNRAQLVLPRPTLGAVG